MGKPATVRHAVAMRRSAAVRPPSSQSSGRAPRSRSRRRRGPWNEAAIGAVVVAYAAVGLLIVWHRPGNPVGRIALLGAMAWGPGQLLVDLGANGLREDPGNRGAALASVLGSSLGGLAWLVLVLWLPLVFPDGFTGSSRLRRAARRVVAVTIGCFAVVSILSPHLTRIEFADIDNPIGLPHALTGVLDALAGLSLLLGLASLGLVVACLVQQYRRGGPADAPADPRLRDRVRCPHSLRSPPASATPQGRGCSASAHFRCRSRSAWRSSSAVSTTCHSSSTGR